MKIAVTYEDGQVFQHFGHTENFKIYDVRDAQIDSSEVIDTAGNGHGALAGFLKDHGVQVLICGGIGGGAREALSDMGIEFYPGVSGSADECVRAFLDGKLSYNPDTLCDHHKENHTCDEEKHGCAGSH